MGQFAKGGLTHFFDVRGPASDIFLIWMNKDIFKLMGDVVTNSQKGRLDEAEMICQEIISIDKDNIFAHVNMANILLIKGYVDRAIEEYRHAERLKPNDLVVKENLALALISKGSYNEAEIEIKAILDINHTHSSAYNLLGNIYFYKRGFHSAKENYERAILLNPDMGDAWSNLGNIYFELEEYNKAEDCYRKSVQINPNNPYWLGNFGKVLFRQGKSELSIESYKKALEINPNLDDIKKSLYNIYIILGEQLLKEGNPKDASKYYEEALKLGKRDIRLYDRLAGIKILLNDYVGACGLVTACKRNFPLIDLKKYPNLKYQWE